MARRTVTRDMMKRAATEAGLVVREEGSRLFIDRKGRGATGIVVYENGSIYRSDVCLDIARRMTPSAAAKHLGIEF